VLLSFVFFWWYFIRVLIEKESASLMSFFPASIDRFSFCQMKMKSVLDVFYDHAVADCSTL